MGLSPKYRGRRSGSRIKFLNENGAPNTLYKLHPRKTLLTYQVKEVVEILKAENIL
ncbi:MAG: type II toxin-antitoxin system HicA family toxin [Lactobacillus kefiranofaciens]